MGTKKIRKEISKTTRYSVCKHIGHNKRNCKVTEPTTQTEPKGKGGRPKEDDPYIEKTR